MGHLRSVFLFQVILLLCATVALGQNQRKLQGLVIDSLENSVGGADIYLIAGKDTLNTSTDTHGRFNFTGFQADKVSLLILSIGFKPFSRNFHFEKDYLQLNVGQLVLTSESNLLDEVIISAKDRPVKFKKDTIQYNAAFYQVSENDRVEDLLRQLPGVEVDANGNASTMGKPLIKLRVNGEDFFTNNVKDFISQLPAKVIDKIEIINDYGDEANFTGIKEGEPQKMLNLVTKAGQNHGKFGNAGVSGGTDKRYGLQANANLWEDTRQIGMNSSSSNTNNEAGVNTNAAAGINYRDKLFTGITASAAYSYDYNNNNSKQQNNIESINPGGIILNELNSQSRSLDNTHHINFNIQSIADKSYFQASLGGSLSERNRDAETFSKQTGLIHQNLKSNNRSMTETPNLNGNVVWARSMDKPGRSMSGGIVMSSGINQVEEDLANVITYFNRINNLPTKDSLVHRFVETENRSNTITADFRYSEPLRSDEDSLVRRNIDFSYFFSLNKTRNSLYTRVNDENGDLSIVDSLSSLYSSSFLQQRIMVSYRYQSKQFNYNLGISAQPSEVRGRYAGYDKILNRQLNLSPIANMNFILSDWNTFSFVYTGVTTPPDIYQLQPVPNISNIQNVIIGNPNLKSSFTHTGNLSFQHTGEKSGSTLMVGLNSSFLENQVVSNVVLVQDTLNTLKQETRFENASGAYQIGTNYSFAYPFANNRFNVEFRGNWDYMNMISFANDLLNTNRNISFSQTLKMRLTRPKFYLSGYATYSYSSNRYAIALLRLRNIETWQFNVNSRVNLNKSLSVTADVSKRINSGYSINISNPLLINLSMEKSLFKNRQGSISVQAYDLLNQGNNLVRSISDNSITDSRFNQITRYVLLSFTYRLQKFGSPEHK